jgi:glycosyltransferase involved in cell wall biosynthesis
MRIGFDAKRAFSNNTGLGNYSRTIINALCRLFPENEYFLYTPSHDKESLYAPPENAAVVLPSNPLSGLLKSYWRTFGISNQLVKQDIDIYHGLSNEIPVGIDKTGVKSVVTIHDLIFMRQPELYARIDRRIYEKKVRNAVEYADRIIAISNQTREDLLELFKADEKKIKVIYQGCNPWFYKKEKEDVRNKIKEKYNLPSKYLLYVGTIEERKDLLSIIRAIHENRIAVHLVAIGRKTPYYTKVKNYIDKHHVGNIHFHHHIENSDLPAIYQQAEAFIYPSHYEGFGIPVLEALNSGIPVITSRGGCLEETAGKGALLIDPGNTGQLGEAITRVLEDEALRQKLTKAGLEHALRFREEETVPELIQLYQDCIS